MSEEARQVYGFYSRAHGIFMYFNGTREQFEELQREIGELMEQEAPMEKELYDDFDSIIEEVAATPYSKFSE